MVLPPARSYTIEAAIRAAAAQFEQHRLSYGHGTNTAIDEASWLVLHALGLSPAKAPDYNAVLDSDDVGACNVILQRRIDERIPAAYLTGRAWFAGHEFICDHRALVPRSPIAELIQQQFYGWLDDVDKPAILDLCTGGGCIAIASAHAAQQSVVHASDISTQALSLARENIELHQMQGRVALFEGSMFEPLDARYDLILSNPPYVDARDIAAMPDEFSHEPMLGLAAGLDGLDLVRTMLAQAADYLQPAGVLVVEVGNSWEALEQVYSHLDFSWLEFEHGGHGVFMLTREQLLL